VIFNNIEFLFIFLPTVVAVFFAPGMARWRCYWLLAASAVFYGLSGLEHLMVLIFGVVWTFLITRDDRIIGNKWLLTIAILGPALGLIYFKYAGFIFQDILQISEKELASNFSLFENVVLPAGISFFTFQMISLSIDRYRGSIPKMPPLNQIALYISFFPQLVAGPILRFHDVSDRLAALNRFRINRDDIYAAAGFIIFGLASKVLLADGLARYIDELSVSPGALSSVDSVYVVLAFSFQIYFDFYGYSLVAIGLGRIFGFRFPDNFLRPYEALNPQDFWRRWHVTLSYWIRDYVYLSLGGNRSYIRNIIIVFALCGLWHGAGLTFVIWGIYHGVLVAGYRLVGSAWDRMPKIIQLTANFTLVSLGWILFLFDFEGAYGLVSSLLGQAPGDPETHTKMTAWAMLLISATVCFFVNFESLIHRGDDRKFVVQTYSVGLASLMMLVLLFVNSSTDFIYFRF
jgi:alginate O-acetyltransferase complex protein AlgI